ncbi:VWA domain-containing protein [Candidatus Woesearchaeota archaeon]|nr:VWA domain-containing protein [Candidatus Woesearchaeota archaeon]
MYRKTEEVPNRNHEDIDEQSLSEDSADTSVTKKEKEDELQGKLSKDNRDDKLLHSKLNVDKQKIDEARVLTDALNNNISSFTPDLAYEKMVNNYNNAKQLFGPTLIRELSGYDPNYVEKNINIPEFQRELKDRIKNNIDKLKKDGLLNKEGDISEEGYEFAALSILNEYLDNLETQGYYGKKESKKLNMFGEREDFREYKQGDRYKDLALKQTLKRTIRRKHKEILKKDVVINDRKATGKLDIVYLIDASGSMKGDKIKVAKKAGIALAYSAIKNKDSVGLVVFGSEIDEELPLGNDFLLFAKSLNKIRTKGETDIAQGIKHSLKLFSSNKTTKHVVVLSDALQTTGKKPEKEVMEAVSMLTNSNISVSLVGISLNEKGEIMAKNIVDLSGGRLYLVKTLDTVDQIVLEDYYSTKSQF